jgi:hypothetical protein
VVVLMIAAHVAMVIGAHHVYSEAMQRRSMGRIAV